MEDKETLTFSGDPVGHARGVMILPSVPDKEILAGFLDILHSFSH